MIKHFTLIKNFKNSILFIALTPTLRGLLCHMDKQQWKKQTEESFIKSFRDKNTKKTRCFVLDVDVVVAVVVVVVVVVAALYAFLEWCGRA